MQCFLYVRECPYVPTFAKGKKRSTTYAFMVMCSKVVVQLAQAILHYPDLKLVPLDAIKLLGKKGSRRLSVRNKP